MKENITTKALILAIIIVLVSGFLFYNLVDIPFGFLFNLSFICLAGSISTILIILAIKLFKSKKKWHTFIGSIPIVVALIIVLLTSAISIDYRMLIFKGTVPEITKEEWVEDLNYLSKQMLKMHPGFKADYSIEDFNKLKEEIEMGIPKMAETEIIMELFKLNASIKDAHTFPLFFAPHYNLHAYPIRIVKFEEGWFIIDADRSHKNLIGSKLIKIGSKKIGDIYKLFPAFLATENNTSKLERFTYLAVMPEWLYSQGIIKHIDDAEFVVENNMGEISNVNIQSERMLNYFYWRTFRKLDNSTSAVYESLRQEDYKIELLNNSKTLYIQCNTVSNEIVGFSKRLDEFIKTNKFERCVIDLRNNLGGDDYMVDRFVSIIRDNKLLNIKEQLFVLIGRQTLSAGVTLATRLQLQTKAIFIGEPTAQGSIFYANVDFITLPNSKLLFTVSKTSTARSQAIWPFRPKSEITPNIKVKYTHEDFINKIDPAMEVVLNYNLSENNSIKITDNSWSSFSGRYLLDDMHVMDVSIKDSSAKFIITDFIQGSMFYVESDLYQIEDDNFATDIHSVFVSLKTDSLDKSKYIILDWLGQKKKLENIHEDKEFAMEILNRNVGKAVQIIWEEKEKYLKQFSMLESVLINIGYEKLNENNIKDALLIFKLSVDIFPNSYNVYDSYGEALLKNGEKDDAIKNYKKSVELNPDNEHGKRVLEDINEN